MCQVSINTCSHLEVIAQVPTIRTYRLMLLMITSTLLLVWYCEVGQSRSMPPSLALLTTILAGWLLNINTMQMSVCTGTKHYTNQRLAITQSHIPVNIPPNCHTLLLRVCSQLFLWPYIHTQCWAWSFLG